jgi:hypothetical protein
LYMRHGVRSKPFFVLSEDSFNIRLEVKWKELILVYLANVLRDFTDELFGKKEGIRKY